MTTTQRSKPVKIQPVTAILTIERKPPAPKPDAAIRVNTNPPTTAKPRFPRWAIIAITALTGTTALFLAGMWAAHVTAALMASLGKLTLGAAAIVIVAVIICSAGRRHCPACPGIKR